MARYSLSYFNKLRRWRLTSWIILAGIVYSLSIAIVGIENPGIHVSGDSGLKSFIATETWSRILYSQLPPARNDFERHLWTLGLYPFEPPFSYEHGGERTLGFPPYFQLLSAPFIQLFGYPGHFLLPLAALWIFWFNLECILRNLRLSGDVISATMAITIFGTHLSPYGGMFWEHTLSVACISYGITFLSLSRQQPHSGMRVFGLGALAGLSVYFRPEALPVLILLTLAGFAIFGLRDAAPRGFLAGVITAVASFFLCNLALFGAPLGVHGQQVTESLSPLTILRRGLKNELKMVVHLIAHVPVILPIALSIVILRRQTIIPARSRLIVFGVICTTAIITIAFLMPNVGGKELGPRYYLVLVPIIMTIVGLTLSRVIEHRVKYRTLLLISFGSAAVLGICSNLSATYRGVIHDYRHRIKPALQVVKKNSAPILVASRQSVFHDLLSLYNHKTMVLARDEAALNLLCAEMIARGEHSLLLINRRKPPKSGLEGRLRFHEGAIPIIDPSNSRSSAVLHVSGLGKHGDLEILHGLIKKEATTQSNRAD